MARPVRVCVMTTLPFVCLRCTQMSQLFQYFWQADRQADWQADRQADWQYRQADYMTAKTFMHAC